MSKETTKVVILTTAQDAFQSGEEPTLELVLHHRENRVQFQNKLVAMYPKNTLIALKVNMPGPIKNNELVQALIGIGKQLLKTYTTNQGWQCVYEKDIDTLAGVEYFVVVDEPSITNVKKAMIDLEDHQLLGRLFDLDVFQSDYGSISREDLGYTSRRCLICHESSKDCGRNRTHSVRELHEKIIELLKEEGSVTFND
ncbi:citrate lyase holo-[acyl-carrier protein] synthase [Erysipelothrix sp. HDW6C]|uniref:citrate lyase holo-[acyl-carrier protein] synthase n=1 Tax=Erysipelothrix sp. HDW6C TaxID=2714930 RepID=UPI00140B5C8D|nr:citrate lyase holo-[acyl-carrier protein] synthase [Erysipelothrix sp. HDW6C]QIK69599.1 citrate lyase holo-[acyl-carrier protein] synthase [Erysipelothrix sp. HDW6C]